MVGYRKEMDYFENHSYWFIRLILLYTGLWPYANRRTRCIASSVQIFGLTIITSSSLFKFITLFPSVESIIYTLGLLSTCLIVCLSYLMYLYKMPQLKKLWLLIENDWKKLEKVNKISIAERYAYKSNLLSLYVTILISIYYILICLETLLPYILGFIFMKQSDDLKMPIAVELSGKYHISLALVTFFFLMLLGIVAVVCISELIIFVHHACLLFSLTGDILEHGFTNIEKTNNAIEKDETLYNAIVESIQYHRSAIGFCKIIEDTYTIICLYVMIAVILMLASNSLRFFHTFLSRDVYSTITSLLTLFFSIAIAFAVTHTGQLLIDHSLGVFDKACSVPWYIASFKSQKLLTVILTRAIKPSYLTHGKIAILSHTLFTMLLNKAISVTTVVISKR